MEDRAQPGTANISDFRKVDQDGGPGFSKERNEFSIQDRRRNGVEAARKFDDGEGADVFDYSLHNAQNIPSVRL
jgi:hypothetical protein